MSKNNSKALSQKKIKNIRTTIEMKNTNSAYVQIEEYIDIFGENCYILLEKARYLKLINKLDDSIDMLQSLIESYPENIGYVLFELAKCYESKSMINEAIETYKGIENTNHKDKSYAYYSLANLYESIYMYSEAVSYYEKVISHNEKLKEFSKLHLAKIYRYLKNYEKSLEILDSIIAKNDTELKCSVLYAKAKIYKKLENHKLAHQYLDDILIKYDPNYSPAIFEKLYACLHENKLIEAQRLYSIIEQEDYDNDYFRLIKGEYNLRMQNIEEAKKYYDMVISTNNMYNTLAYLGLGRLNTTLGNISLARECYKKVLEQNDEYYVLCLLQLSQLELFDGNYEDAFNCFKQINPQKIMSPNVEDYIKLKLTMEIIFNIPTVVNTSKKYGTKQLINYNINDAIKHIEYGHKSKQQKGNTIFNDDIDIKKLMEEIPKQLTLNNLIEISSAAKYSIYFPNVGYIDDTQLDYLIVVTELHNRNILTMYPCNKYGIEELEIEEHIEKPKQKEIKRISQIDKFNKKYSIS